MSRWLLLKDIMLTVAGTLIVFSQVFSAHPSRNLLMAGVALAGSSLIGQRTVIVSGRGGGGGKPPSSPPRRVLLRWPGRREGGTGETPD